MRVRQEKSPTGAGARRGARDEIFCALMDTEPNAL
jgi:hypothetical protein